MAFHGRIAVDILSERFRYSNIKTRTYALQVTQVTTGRFIARQVLQEPSKETRPSELARNVGLSCRNRKGSVVNIKQKVRQHTKKSATMGALGKLLAIMLALNMAFMLALPIGIFADDIVINGGEIEAVYGDPGGQATTPSPAEAETGQPTPTPAEGGVIDIGTQNTPTAEPAPNPDEGIAFTPLGINGTVWEVSTWGELRQAFADANAGKVNEIKLMNDVYRSSDKAESNDLPKLTASVVINGNNKTLYFAPAGDDGSVPRNGIKLDGTVARTITVKDITISRTNSKTSALIGFPPTNAPALGNTAYAPTKSWTVVLENLKSLAPQPSPLVSLSDGAVIFRGNNEWIQSSGTGVEEEYTTINARMVTFDGGSTTIKSTARVLRGYLSDVNDNANYPVIYTAQNGAKVNLESTGTG